MSNFAILRVGKLKSAAKIRGMLKHNFRAIETPNANPDKTATNEHLSAVSVEDGMRRYRERLPDKVRKNAVHAIDYMVTTSPDATKDANERSLAAAYDWLKSKHGEENIIMASIHKDETTPHAHFLVMPIDERGKLNARHFIGGSKHRLSELQDEYHQMLTERGIDLNRGVKGSKAKHQRISDYYKNLNRETPEITAEDLKPQGGLMSKEKPEQIAARLNEKVKTLADQAVLSKQNARRAAKMKETNANAAKAIKAANELREGLTKEQLFRLELQADTYRDENKKEKERERVRKYIKPKVPRTNEPERER